MEDNRQVSNLRAEASKGDSDAVGLRMLEDAKTHLLPWMVRLGPEQPEKVMLPETPPRRPVLGGSGDLVLLGNLGPRSAMCFKASEVGASGAGALRRHQSQWSVPRRSADVARDPQDGLYPDAKTVRSHTYSRDLKKIVQIYSM